MQDSSAYVLRICSKWIGSGIAGFEDRLGCAPRPPRMSCEPRVDRARGCALDPIEVGSYEDAQHRGREVTAVEHHPAPQARDIGDRGSVDDVVTLGLGERIAAEIERDGVRGIR